MARFLVEDFGVADQFGPVVGGLEIDLDDAGIGRDLEMLDAGIVRRGVALDAHGQAEFGGGVLDGGDEVEIIFRSARWAA